MTETQDPPQKPSFRARRKALRRRIAGPLVRILGPLLLKGYALLWRKRTVHESEAAKAALTSGCLAVLWHGRGASLIPIFRGYRAAILVSPSKDGQLMTDLLQAYGFDTIVGSSRHGGTEALRELLGTLRDGRTICLTPDGPPGPEHTVAPTVAFLSRATGFPVVPVGLGVSRAWRLSTYDRYTVPTPFARLVAYVAEPIQVPREARGEEAQAEWAESVRASLVQAEERAFRELGMEPDP